MCPWIRAWLSSVPHLLMGRPYPLILPFLLVVL